METKSNKRSYGERLCLFLLLSLLVLIIPSCATPYRSLWVDIQQPAKVSTPVEIAKVLVVNNAITQPNNEAIEIFFDKKPYRLKNPLNLDTMSWHVVNELGAMLNQAQFFNEVSVYNQALRSDDKWLSILPLTDEFRRKIFDEEGFDAIISIDRLLFDMKHEAQRMEKTDKEITDWNFSELPLHAQLKVRERVSCSLYTYDRETARTSFTIQDSITYKGTLDVNSQTLFYHIPELAMRELSLSMGAELAGYFAATWESQERIIYIGSNSRMKEAERYFNNQKYNQAIAIWTELYEKEKQAIDKMRLALNLALIYEVQDQFKESMLWLEKALSDSKALKQKKEKPEEVKYLESYSKGMEERIKAEPLLDLQMKQ